MSKSTERSAKWFCFGIAAFLCAVALCAVTPAWGISFPEYWYQGKAELTSYTLEQARYGELHPGEAVLVFVTEDLSQSKHVKLDRPSQAGSDAVKGMKLNFTKKFNTGVYPYSMMTSVFSPVDRPEDPHSLKVTTSSQEWCGHTFVQLDRQAKGYHYQQHSYFEGEGEAEGTLASDLLEDELWVRIRLDPRSLPTGSLKLLLGTQVQRLLHLPWRVYRAEASLASHAKRSGLWTYTLTYPDLGRTLTIHFEKAFPHVIEGWEESYVSGWGQEAEQLTTRATRKKRILLDYWNRHGLEDSQWRSKLELDGND